MDIARVEPIVGRLHAGLLATLDDALRLQVVVDSHAGGVEVIAALGLEGGAPPTSTQDG